MSAGHASKHGKPLTWRANPKLMQVSLLFLAGANLTMCLNAGSAVETSIQGWGRVKPTVAPAGVIWGSPTFGRRDHHRGPLHRNCQL
jgi:hypothetical protein